MPTSLSGPDEDRVSYPVALLAIADFLRCSAEVYVPFRDLNEQSASSWNHYIHEKQQAADSETKSEQLADNLDLDQCQRERDIPEASDEIIAEMTHVLKHEVFKKSPTLRLLLRWLVRETMAARGGLVQSYTVSVYNLEWTKNSDASTEQCSGVQMARLRKALESYYAQCGSVTNQGLYILPGTYGIRFGSLESAYPNI